MDPNACLERLRIAYCEGDVHEITFAADDLLEWIKNDGFIPKVSEPQLSALLIMSKEYAGQLIDDSCPDCGATGVNCDCGHNDPR